MGITLGSNFDVQTGLPLDSRDVVANNTARDAINSGRRYEGLKVYSIAAVKTYQLQGGILNSNWIDITAASGPTVSTGLTAFSGGGQASATALPSDINQIATVATAGDSVKLPSATAGKQIIVINDGANSVNIFPQTGEQIDGLGVNAAFGLSTSTKNVRFICAVAGTWKSAAGGSNLTLAAVGSAPNISGATISSGVLNLEPADATRPGVLTALAQTFGGIKTFFDRMIRSSANGITAFSGGGQASAVALTKDFNRVTTVAAANDSVKLPLGSAGLEMLVINDGANSLNVFPETGEQIDALGANNPYAISTSIKSVRFICVSAGLWRALPNIIPNFTAVGSTPNANAASISGSSITLQPANATNPGVISILAQSIAGAKTFIDSLLRSSATGLTAFAGGGQASATQLTKDINLVNTVATAGDSVKLPAAVAGAEVVVINDGAASLNIFPATGEAINALATNAAFALSTTDKNVRFICASTGLWKTAAGGGSAVGLGFNPTVQKFISGSGTYSTPLNVAWIRVRMVGGGGGGSGSGNASIGTGGSGTTTTFGTSLLVANGGQGGQSSGTGSVGGAASLGSGPVGTAFKGSDGQVGQGNSSAAVVPGSGSGGSSPFGGAGGGSVGLTAGYAAGANTGSGGGGGGGSGSISSGMGGAAGGYVDAIIYSPLSTYNYSVGTGGAAGAAGASGTVGGAGADGIIIIEEYYLLGGGGGGGISRVIQNITSTVTGSALPNTDYTYRLNAGAVFTMPTAVGNTNRYTIKNMDTTNKTISFTGGQTGDGSSTVILTPNTSVDLISDNSNWGVY